MILTRVVRELFQRKDSRGGEPIAAIPHGGKCVLNVGGGNKQIPIPAHYTGWTHLLLDIDSGGNPDVVCDARNLFALEAGQFDAVYCSHNLEHYYKHDGSKVLKGFLHILRSDGFAEIRVPDLRCVMKRMITTGLDIEDTLYVSPAGPITVRDVIYGWSKQIESSGVDFYAHKTGFTSSSLQTALDQAGFLKVFVTEREEAFEVHALAFKNEPTDRQRALLGL